MPLRVSNIRLRWDEPEATLPARISSILGIKSEDLSSWRILRKSLDARDKGALQFVYAAEVTFPDAEAFLAQRANRQSWRDTPVDLYVEPPFIVPPSGNQPLPHRPIIVGTGPGGLLAGYILAEQGYRPILLERGRAVRDRIRDVKDFDAGGVFQPESNYLYGEGGAGTFSDGKLTYRGSGPDVKRVLEVFARCNGKPSILYEQRPHLGSNRLPAVVKALRRRIEEFGGEVRHGVMVTDIDLSGGEVRGVSTTQGFIASNVVMLAIGHSARDTFAMLHARGVPLEQKPFQMGVRIEQPQAEANRFKFGSSPLEDRLGPADYSMVVRGSRDLFTFCMCAGGYIMPSVSSPGEYCTNGMSLANHDSPFANSGLVVTVEPSEFGGVHPLAGIHLQERYERAAYALSGDDYKAPLQRATDFMNDRKSDSVPENTHPRGAVSARMEEVLPPQIAEALRTGLPLRDRQWRGRLIPSSHIAGPETRGSSPVRIVRETDSRQSPGIVGLYPLGEGAGYAGGIVSAALDGLRSAISVIARHRVPDA